ncbi:MAG: glycoside hydrolase family 18 protein [Terracidiphilus sp.]
MHRIVIVCVLAWIALSAAAQKPPRKMTITGYVFPQNHILPPGQINAGALTRINYAFGVLHDGTLGPASAVDAQNLAFLAGLRKQNPSLKVLISIGGWNGSGGFSDAALTAQSRAAFVESVVDFLRGHDLDGLDVDWEYPGLPGAGNKYRPEDTRNFTLLLKDLRQRFDREQKATGRRLILTIAAGASKEYLAHTEMKQVQRYVDAVNLMTYDYARPSTDALTGFNAPLHTDPAAPRQESVDASVRAFEQAGVPAGKILIGIPFYSHVWQQVPDRNHGLFQPGKPAPNDFAPFGTIRLNMLGQGYVRYWDQAASVPYLYSAEKQQFVSYDDAESIAAKCDYAVSSRLGGVMFWEYLDDPSGELLEAIDHALFQSHNPSR